MGRTELGFTTSKDHSEPEIAALPPPPPHEPDHGRTEQELALPETHEPENPLREAFLKKQTTNLGFWLNLR